MFTPAPQTGVQAVACLDTKARSAADGNRQRRHRNADRDGRDQGRDPRETDAPSSTGITGYQTADRWCATLRLPSTAAIRRTLEARLEVLQRLPLPVLSEIALGAMRRFGRLWSGERRHRSVAPAER